MELTHKKTHKPIGERGSLKWIIIVIIAIIVASYFFDFNLQEAVEDEQTQSNFQYIINHIVEFYNQYLRPVVEYIWNFISSQL